MPTDPATITVPPLTEKQIAEAWEEESFFPWRELGSVRARYLSFAHRIAALAASRVDTAEVERTAAHEALTRLSDECWTHGKMHPDAVSVDVMVLRFRDREYPAPAPRECVPIKCVMCRQDGADLSTGIHATRDECIEALGKRLAAEVGQ